SYANCLTLSMSLLSDGAPILENPRRETLGQVGITEYLEKPIRLKDLDAVIERFVPKSKEPH
ncbi:MAG: hypothetical protein ACTHMB_15925, partial [Candidatus Binatia bacterium]